MLPSANTDRTAVTASRRACWLFFGRASGSIAIPMQPNDRSARDDDPNGLIPGADDVLIVDANVTAAFTAFGPVTETLRGRTEQLISEEGTAQMNSTLPEKPF